MIRKLAVFFILSILAAKAGFCAQPTSQDVINRWYKLTLELIRHTPTYTPPVASRSLAYLGVTAYEAAASGSNNLQSLAGQLNELTPLPQRQAGSAYDEAIVMQAALGTVVQQLFINTGPTGQHVMSALDRKLSVEVSEGIDPALVAKSQAFGQAIAQHILGWSQSDGGAVVENLGFPAEYNLNKEPGHWVPTNAIRLQQSPLLPNWGNNRPFAMKSGSACDLPPPPKYSEEKSSEFYKQALEVYDTTKILTPDQRAIARFWADDAMTSTTPPGHWISIVLQIEERDKFDAEKTVDVLARLGVSLADAFIGCWKSKYQYDLIRPISYIHHVIDPKWETPIITPPFPEYPSGHSTQSGAAATVLTNLLGDNFAFHDDTGKGDNLASRDFKSFWDAADDAGISRLYGGIHFRAAIENGLQQGRCIGAATNALKTRK